MAYHRIDYLLLAHLRNSWVRVLYSTIISKVKAQHPLLEAAMRHSLCFCHIGKMAKRTRIGQMATGMEVGVRLLLKYRGIVIFAE